MNNRFISAFLAFILCVITNIAPLAPALAHASAQPSPDHAAAFCAFEGRGSESEPFLISNSTELFLLASLVNSGVSTRGVFFRSCSDIDLHGESWIPIGRDAGRPFEGSFDGGDHTISGLDIDTDAEFVGLFGYSIGAISSIVIKDSTIRGGDAAGAIVGFGTVENCISFASVTGKNRVGGIVGEGAAYGCENRGSVSGESEIGGIVGRGEAHGCYNYGFIEGTSRVGAIFGLGTELECENCGSVNEAAPVEDGKAKHSVAQFIRWALTHVDPESIPTNANLYLPAESCGSSPWEYLYGSVRVPTSQTTLNYFFNNNYTRSMRRHQYDDITEPWSRSTYATDCQGLLDAWLTYEEGESTDINVQMNYQYWCTDKGLCSEITRPYVIGEAVFHYSRRTERMTHIGWICGFDEDGKALAVEARGFSFGVVVTRVEDRGWTYRGLMTNKFNYDASMPSSESAESEKVRSEVEKFPLKQRSIPSASDVPIWDGSIASGFAGGSGTQQDPYLITNGSELMYLSRAVKNGNSFYGKHFRMTADIRLNDTSDWQDWDILYGPENAFEPIGSYENSSNYSAFRGSFDGGGHTVYGLYYSTPNASFHGIFGCVGPNPNGCIKDLSLAESYLNAVNNSGGIIGYLEDYGSVTGCSNFAMLTCDLWVGGIVGCVKTTSASTLISNCVNAGRVYGTSDTGGIVGFADTLCTITDCSGKGLAKSYERTGGIVGTAKSASIENCRNDGIVRGTDVIGGIAGELRSSSLKKCYNAYSLSTKYRTGGLAGISKQSDIINCFNTGGVSLLENAGGLVGRIDGGRVENCYSVGTVNARRHAGAALGSCAAIPAFDRVYVLRGCCAGSSAFGVEQEGYEFAEEAGYSGFDLASVWTISSETEYPFAELREVSYTSENIPEYEPFVPPETPTPEPTPTPTPSPSPTPRPTLPPLPPVSPTPEPQLTPTPEPSGLPQPTQSHSPVKPTPEPTAEPLPEPLWGDVDGDGSISISDAILLMRHAMGVLDTEPVPDIMNGDMDHDGVITFGDAIALLRAVLGVTS